LKLQLPAKVNWTLRVLGRRPDGFHELRSWFVAVGLTDRLEARPAPDASGSTLRVGGPAAGEAGPEVRNLILAAEAAWRRAGGGAPPVAWKLEKHIPAGAGLGGGSSDAAGALRCLEALARRPLGAAACARVALEIGSDVPFFLSGGGAELRGGRGELPLASALPPEGVVVLAVPPFSVSTRAVYQRLSAPPVPPATSSPEAGLFPPRPGPNDLEPAAVEAFPELRAFAAALREQAPFHLSGSGGAHFAFLREPNEAQALCGRLKDLPGLRLFLAPILPAAVLPEMEGCG